MEQDFKPVYNEVNPENLIGVEIRSGNTETVEEVFDYDKDSNTIQEELKKFEKIGETKEEIESFGFDDFGEGSENEEGVEEAISSDEEQTQDNGEVEDYFDSAEFVIFILDIVVVLGTNFYLKYKKLDKITIKDFDKTKGQQKLLVKSLAKVMHKYNAKVSPEMELIFALGSAYGMKVNGIVNSQKAKKYDEMIKAQKEGAKAKVGKAKPVKKEKVNESEGDIKAPKFDVDFGGVVEVEDIPFESIRNDSEKDSSKDNKKKPNSQGLIGLTD